LCLTGPVVWWPRTRRDAHGTVGIWTVPMLTMWAFTALPFAFPAAFRAAVNTVSPITISRAPQSTPGATDRDRLAWSALLEAARPRAPGQYVARVVLPANDRGAFLVMFSDVSPTPAGTAALTPVYLDQFTGAVVQETPRGRHTAGDVRDGVGRTAACRQLRRNAHQGGLGTRGAGGAAAVRHRAL
jgi:uncharacterized iron-regulated membrane protein